MILLKQIIVPLLSGLLGGAVAGLIAIQLVSERGVFTAADLARPARIEFSAERLKEETLESRVLLIRPDPKSTLVSSADAFGVGLAVSSDGLIVTAQPLPSTKGVVAVSFDRQPFEIEFAKDAQGAPFKDEQSGLTFLKRVIQNNNAPALRAISPVQFEELYIGQQVLALDRDGTLQFQRIRSLTAPADPKVPIFSDGVVSTIALDALLEPGTPVITLKGQLVGIAKEGGRLIPGESVANLVRQYLSHGKYQPTKLGIHFLDLSTLVPLNEAFPTAGLLLVSGRGRSAVIKRSPAEKAGLREGDLILAFDSQRLDGRLPFGLLLQRYRPGVEVELLIRRLDKEEKVKVKLAE